MMMMMIMVMMMMLLMMMIMLSMLVLVIVMVVMHASDRAFNVSHCMCMLFSASVLSAPRIQLEPLLLPWEQVLGGGGASSAYR